MSNSYSSSDDDISLEMSGGSLSDLDNEEIDQKVEETTLQQQQSADSKRDDDAAQEQKTKTGDDEKEAPVSKNGKMDRDNKPEKEDNKKNYKGVQSKTQRNNRDDRYQNPKMQNYSKQRPQQGNNIRPPQMVAPWNQPPPQSRGPMPYGQFFNGPPHMQQMQPNYNGNGHMQDRYHPPLPLGQYRGEDQQLRRQLHNLRDGRKINISEDLFPLERPKKSKNDIKSSAAGKLQIDDVKLYHVDQRNRQELIDQANQIKTRNKLRFQDDDLQRRRASNYNQSSPPKIQSRALNQRLQAKQDQYGDDYQTNTDYLDDEKFLLRKLEREQKQREKERLLNRELQKKVDKKPVKDMEFPSIFQEEQSDDLVFPSIYKESDSTNLDMPIERSQQKDTKTKVQSKVIGTQKAQSSQDQQITPEKNVSNQTQTLAEIIALKKQESARIFTQMKNMKDAPIAQKMLLLKQAKDCMNEIDELLKKEKEKKQSGQAQKEKGGEIATDGQDKLPKDDKQLKEDRPLKDEKAQKESTSQKEDKPQKEDRSLKEDKLIKDEEVQKGLKQTNQKEGISKEKPRLKLDKPLKEDKSDKPLKVDKPVKEDIPLNEDKPLKVEKSKKVDNPFKVGKLFKVDKVIKEELSQKDDKPVKKSKPQNEDQVYKKDTSQKKDKRQKEDHRVYQANSDSHSQQSASFEKRQNSIEQKEYIVYKKDKPQKKEKRQKEYYPVQEVEVKSQHHSQQSGSLEKNQNSIDTENREIQQNGQQKSRSKSRESPLDDVRVHKDQFKKGNKKEIQQYITEYSDSKTKSKKQRYRSNEQIDAEIERYQKKLKQSHDRSQKPKRKSSAMDDDAQYGQLTHHRSQPNYGKLYNDEILYEDGQAPNKKQKRGEQSVLVEVQQPKRVQAPNRQKTSLDFNSFAKKVSVFDRISKS